MTEKQTRIIRILETFGPKTAKDIAERLQTTELAASSMLQRMLYKKQIGIQDTPTWYNGKRKYKVLS